MALAVELVFRSIYCKVLVEQFDTQDLGGEKSCWLVSFVFLGIILHLGSLGRG